MPEQTEQLPTAAAPGQLQVPEPQPVPMVMTCDGVQTTQGPAVRLAFYSVTGQHVVFVPADNAVAFAQQIIETANKMKSGLVLPPGFVVARQG